MRNALGLAVAAALLGALPVEAQMRRGPMTGMARMPSRGFAYGRISQPPAPVRVVHSNQPVVISVPQRQVIRPGPLGPSSVQTAAETTVVEPSNSAFAPFGGTPIPLGQLLNPTPGLGFDFNHLAAVNSGLAVRAFIDPVTEHELAVTESLPEEAPVGVGFFPAFGFTGVAPVTTQQPEVIVVQEPVPQTVSTAAAAATPAPVAALAPAPPLPVGKLYLVRRDGTEIQAIAFIQQDGQIVYITQDGMRHSVALDDLDIQATEQRNAESGVIVHLENKT